jgi:hypothetical protein
MTLDATEQIIRAYRDYDRRCDVVSCFEVYFTEARQMRETVAHFERFPRLVGVDGEPATPDFTVRFVDGTMLVGEISRLARTEGSLESLLRQIERYQALMQGPSAPRSAGGHEVEAVEAVDVLVLMPSGEANAARDRVDAVLSAAAQPDVVTPEVDAVEATSGKSRVTVRPCILGYAYDDESGRFIFTYDDRANNPRPRSHNRDPTLETWLQKNSDTLTCPSERFSRVSAVKRFMNDRPPAIYTATLLWLDAFPAQAEGIPPVDLSVVPAQTARWLRSNYGWGDANAVRDALEFLQRAGLARQRESDWVVALKPIANNREEVRRELIDRYLSRPRGPVTIADREDLKEKRRQDSAATERNRAAQEQLRPQTADDEN